MATNESWLLLSDDHHNKRKKSGVTSVGASRLILKDIFEELQPLKTYQLADYNSVYSSLSATNNIYKANLNFTHSEFCPLTYELSGDKLDDVTYKYEYTISLGDLFRKSWSQVVDVPLDFSKSVFGQESSTGQGYFGNYKCDESKREGLEKEFPFKVKMSGGVMEVDSPIHKGISFRQGLCSDTLQEVSQMFAYLICWGHSRISQQPKKLIYSIYCLAHYSHYNSCRIIEHMHNVKKARENVPDAKLCNLISIPAIKLTLMTMRKTGQILFKAIGPQITLTKTRLLKSKKITSKNIYDNWMWMEKIYNKLFAVSEDDILSMEEAELESFTEIISRPPEEVRFLTEKSRLRMKTFLERAIKCLHPLSTVVIDAAEEMVPEVLREKLRTEMERDAQERSLYWMKSGRSYTLSGLVRVTMMPETTICYNEEKKNQYVTVKGSTDRSEHLWGSLYLRMAGKSLFLIDRKANSEKRIARLSAGRFEAVMLATSPQRSRCFIPGKISDEFNAARVIFEIKIPKSDEEIDELSSFKPLVRFEPSHSATVAIWNHKIIASFLTNTSDKVEVHKFTDAETLEVLSATIQDHCTFDEDAGYFLKAKQKIGGYMSMHNKVIANNSHILMTSTISTDGKSELLVYGFNYQKKGAPFLFAKYSRDYRQMHPVNCMVRLNRSIGHLSINMNTRLITLLAVQKDALVRVIQQKFPSSFSKLYPVKKSTFRSPGNRGDFETNVVLTFDNQLHRLNAWHCRRQGGKYALKVNVFQLRF